MTAEQTTETAAEPDTVRDIRFDLESQIIDMDSLIGLVIALATMSGKSECYEPRIFHAIGNNLDALKGELEEIHDRLIAIEHEPNAAASA